MDDESALLASASGIMHCLQLLADEAAVLRLNSAVSAIQEALQTVALESGADAFRPFADIAEPPPPTTLH